MQEITAFYITLILFIQYPTHYEMRVPLYEYVFIIHCLFHDWKHYKSQITLAKK